MRMKASPPPVIKKARIPDRPKRHLISLTKAMQYTNATNNVIVTHGIRIDLAQVNLVTISRSHLE